MYTVTYKVEGITIKTHQFSFFNTKKISEWGDRNCLFGKEKSTWTLSEIQQYSCIATYKSVEKATKNTVAAVAKKTEKTVKITGCCPFCGPDAGYNYLAFEGTDTKKTCSQYNCKTEVTLVNNKAVVNPKDNVFVINIHDNTPDFSMQKLQQIKRVIKVTGETEKVEEFCKKKCKFIAEGAYLLPTYNHLILINKDSFTLEKTKIDWITSEYRNHEAVLQLLNLFKTEEKNKQQIKLIERFGCTNVSITNKYLTFTTPSIVCEYKDKKYKIGKLKIKTDLFCLRSESSITKGEGASVQKLNDRHSQENDHFFDDRDDKQFLHPHVYRYQGDRTFGACWGTGADLIDKLLLNGRYAETVLIMLKILGKFHPDNGSLHPEYWPEIKTKTVATKKKGKK